MCVIKNECNSIEREREKNISGSIVHDRNCMPRGGAESLGCVAGERKSLRRREGNGNGA